VFDIAQCHKVEFFYYSVDKIRDLLDKTPEDVIVKVFRGRDVTPPSVKRVNFIKEYCSDMQPFACALDIFQGKQNIFIGYLLPTLVLLEKKLKTLKPLLKYTGSLVHAVLAGIDKRFSVFFDRTNLIIVSVTLPRFKLRWLDDTSKERVRSLLNSYASAQHDSSPDTGSDGMTVKKMSFSALVPVEQIKVEPMQKFTCIRVI
jgi:hypothetical protein